MGPYSFFLSSFEYTIIHVAPRKCRLFSYFLLHKAGEGVQWIKVKELKPENLITDT